MDTSDLIIQFCGITGADPAKAESYLQVLPPSQYYARAISVDNIA